MAIYFSLSAKSDNKGRREILIRYKSGDYAARAKSGVYSSPEWFEFVKGNNSETPYKGKKIITEEMDDVQCFHGKQKTNLSEINGRIADALKDADRRTSDWLNDCIDKFYQRGRHTPNVEFVQTFFEALDEFLEKHPLSDVRRKNFRVIYRALKRFESYKNNYCGKDFALEIDSVTADTLQSFSDFLKMEHIYFKDAPELYEQFPERRKQKARGQNTVNDALKKIRTFFLWCVKNKKTGNNPFDNFKIEECVYGTPFYITIDERNQLYKLDISHRPELERQRDIFVFQCLVGCRVGDLYGFTKANVINGAIEYIPRKTKDDKQETIRVPLNTIAKEILRKYADFEGKALFPFISQQKYNEAIKKIFGLAGITRSVVICDPITREYVIRPINEVASSHLARRCFVGNMYKKVKDQNLVSALSGHKPNSKEFARYREIDEEMRQELVSMIE
ncbi:MAG: site-specific integrase [Bacteroidales bacterium]|nr:site-specific integrase [Bacteroidales bacterium]